MKDRAKEIVKSYCQRSFTIRGEDEVWLEALIEEALMNEAEAMRRKCLDIIYHSEHGTPELYGLIEEDK